MIKKSMSVRQNLQTNQLIKTEKHSLKIIDIKQQIF